MKFMESVFIDSDYTVRNSTGTILQNSYSGNRMNTDYLQKVPLAELTMTESEIVKKHGAADGKIISQMANSYTHCLALYGQSPEGCVQCTVNIHLIFEELNQSSCSADKKTVKQATEVVESLLKKVKEISGSTQLELLIRSRTSQKVLRRNPAFRSKIDVFKRIVLRQLTLSLIAFSLSI